jgi:hypothetical protein
MNIFLTAYTDDEGIVRRCCILTIAAPHINFVNIFKCFLDEFHYRFLYIIEARIKHINLYQGKKITYFFIMIIIS